MASDDAPEPSYFEAVSVSVTPNMCPISAPVHFAATLDSKHDIKDAFWEFKWMLDSVRRRYVIVLGKTAVTDYAAGKISFDFESNAIDVSGYKPNQLSNVGLLVASLHGSIPGVTPHNTEIGSIQLVVQAMPQGDGMVRCVLNPWET